MKRKVYKRKPGDFEIRVLADGRIIMLAPDDSLVEIARTLTCEKKDLSSETVKNGTA
jgi:hypothetical protein